MMLNAGCAVLEAENFPKAVFKRVFSMIVPLMAKPR